VASSHFELGIVVSEVKQVDGATRVFFQRQRLHHDVAIALWLLDVDQFVDFFTDFEQVRVRVFTYLALKSFPVIRDYVSVFFRLLLEFHPVFETVEVDEADTP